MKKQTKIILILISLIPTIIFAYSKKSSIIEKIIPPIFLTSIGYLIFKKKKK